MPRRPFSEAVRSRPLLFEPTPPSARASPRRAEEHRALIADLVRRTPRIDLLDVPELVDENHEGRPFYRSGDARSFAAELAEASGCPVAVNKIVAHLPSVDAVRAWGAETVALGIRYAVLVGGTSRYIPYPGPTVVDADRALRPTFEGAGGGLGNIAIPQRVGEAHRMLAKTRAGAAFFTTQILFESPSAIALLEEYDGLCRRAGLRPAAVALSFAPMVDEADVEFLRWLGAEVPEAIEREVLTAEEGEGAIARSIDRCLRVWGEIEASIARGPVDVPIGVNVEEILARHVAPTARLLEEFVRALDGDRTGRPPGAGRPAAAAS